MSEAKETIGYAVLPVMAAVGEILATKVVPLVEKLAAAFQERALPVIARAGSIVTNHVVPALLDLGRVFTDRVMPVMEKIGGAVGSALVATWQENIAPAFATVRDVAESLAPTLANIAGTVGELATAVADRLAGPLQAVFGFLADHKDDLKIVAAAFAVAVPVVYAIAAAHAAEATAATAAAVAEGVALLPIIAISAAVGVLALGIYELIKHWDDITAKYPAIGEATEAVKEKLSAFAGWVTDTFVPAVLGIYNGVKDAVDKAVGWVRDNWDTISAIISPAVAALEVVIKGAWNQIQTDIQTVWGVLKGIFDTISALLHGDFSGAWTGLQETVSAVWEGIKGSAQNALTVLQGLGGAFFDALKGIGSNMADGLVNGLATIAEKAGNIAGAIQDALKEAMNIALRWAHDNLKVHVPGFDTHTPFGKIGDFDIAFPLLQLARGGIVDRPTIALIGEAGPEAVVPLTGPNLIREMAPMGASSAAVELHVHISALDTRGLEDFVARNADVFLRPLDLALKRAGQAGLVAAR